ncbi:hypothetical protein Tco_1008739, partial [Tanacetum coccineum]
RSIKRPGADLDQPTSKKSKSNEAQHTSVPPASNPSTAGIFTVGSCFHSLMLKHKLEVEIDGLGNDMLHAEQLILFIKKQLASCVPSD